MTFSNAIKYLRDGRCAKTPSMTGYIHRQDWPVPSGESSEPTPQFPQFSDSVSYVVGDPVFYDHVAYVFVSAHAGAWNPAHVAPATIAYDYEFVENPGYTPQSTVNPERFTFRAYVAGGTTYWKYVSENALEWDARLMQVILQDDWDVFDTEAVESAISNTSRW